jgi:hypothetical protein
VLRDARLLREWIAIVDLDDFTLTVVQLCCCALEDICCCGVRRRSKMRVTLTLTPNLSLRSFAEESDQGVGRSDEREAGSCALEEKMDTPHVFVQLKRRSPCC